MKQVVFIWLILLAMIPFASAETIFSYSSYGPALSVTGSTSRIWYADHNVQVLYYKTPHTQTIRYNEFGRDRTQIKVSLDREYSLGTHNGARSAVPGSWKVQGAYASVPRTGTLIHTSQDRYGRNHLHAQSTYSTSYSSPYRPTTRGYYRGSTTSPSGSIRCTSSACY